MREKLLQIAAQADRLTRSLTLRDGERLVGRPLRHDDEDRLRAFIGSLSPRTRRWWQSDGYSVDDAGELCDAIARYDKLRLVAEAGDGSLAALFELSLDLPEGDRERYGGYGVPLDPATDCRFGPCVRDDFQGRGLGDALMPLVREAAGLFGRRRLLLWGGVYADNAPAIAFYCKHGFVEVGRFEDEQGRVSLDMLTPGDCG